MSVKVLVIEDDLEINELLGEYLALEHMGYVQATTGAAGLHVARTQHPDAIILDLMLPDVDGYEIARKLSMHRATHDIPIVILSCMCQDCDREKGYANGALFFMTKPFLPDDLLETVGDALEWKAVLQTRVPGGEVFLGCEGETMACSRGLNQMMADLFSRTQITDEGVEQIREGMELLATWVRNWRKEHPGVGGRGGLKVEYLVKEADKEKNTMGGVEWTLTEEVPGLLTDAFFKARPVGGGGLLGWGAAFAGKSVTQPAAPPAQWMQLLVKVGAARFEKDPAAHSVRFVRSLMATLNAAPVSAGIVPTVEVEFSRVGARGRDEALAGKGT